MRSMYSVSNCKNQRERIETRDLNLVKHHVKIRNSILLKKIKINNEYEYVSEFQK